MKLPKIKVSKLAEQAAPLLIGIAAAWAQRKIGRVADKAAGKLSKRA